MAPGSAADRAGLRAGDVLFAWSDSRGGGDPLQSPFELAGIAAAGQGDVVLRGRRGNQERSWSLASGTPPGTLGIAARPVLAGDLLKLYEEGRRRIDSGEIHTGAGHWRAAVAAADRADLPRPAVWLLGRLAEAYVEARLWAEASATYEEAVERARQSDPAAAGPLLAEWQEVVDRREAALREIASLLQALAGAGRAGTAAPSDEEKDLEQERRRLLALRERLRAETRSPERSHRCPSPPPAQGIEAARKLAWEAETAEAQGNTPLAADLLRRASAALPPEERRTLFASDLLCSRGRLAVQSATGTEGGAHLRSCLEIRQALAPGTLAEAKAAHALGDLYRKAARTDLAAQYLCQAADAPGAPSADHDRDCLAALVEAGRKGDAFRRLEHQRIDSLLELLAGRELRRATLLPAALQRQWDEIASARRRLLDLLSPLSLSREESRIQIGYYGSALRDLEARRRTLAGRIRREAPGAALLLVPEPLGLGAVRRTLDPGTVLLAWSVGETETFLFAMSPQGVPQGVPGTPGTGFEVFRIAAGREALREKVEAFRALLERPGSDPARIAKPARELYDLLLRPADRQVAAAGRLLLSPDGALRVLPFAALLRDPRNTSYLVEQKPIHYVASATLYAHLKRSRPPAKAAAATEKAGAPVRLTTLGDPSYPPLPRNQILGASPVSLVSGAGPSPSLPPLPATRSEVEGVAKLFPAARVLLGEQATEHNATPALQGARYLHFACHGVFDEAAPIRSALALTIRRREPEERDGLLQAWEVFDGRRLEADLVALSASDASPSQADGLAALTLAFQHAGARSVLASLWRKPGDATAGLVKSFYGHLLAGRSKDEALREAQLELLRSEGFAHPAHWAAFQLSGDWKGFPDLHHSKEKGVSSGERPGYRSTPGVPGNADDHEVSPAKPSSPDAAGNHTSESHGLR